MSKFTSRYFCCCQYFSHKNPFNPDTQVVISTYTMLSFTGKRAHDAQIKIDFIKSREWGFLLLDEVHVVPADMFVWQARLFLTLDKKV